MTEVNGELKVGTLCDVQPPKGDGYRAVIVRRENWNSRETAYQVRIRSGAEIGLITHAYESWITPVK